MLLSLICFERALSFKYEDRVSQNYLKEAQMRGLFYSIPYMNCEYVDGKIMKMQKKKRFIIKIFLGEKLHSAVKSKRGIPCSCLVS